MTSIDNVTFVPNLNVNLISLIKFENSGVRYTFENGELNSSLETGFFCNQPLDCVVSCDEPEIAMKLGTLTQKTKWTPENELKDMHSCLGHSWHDRIKHVELRTDVRLNYLFDVCNATKATKNVSRRKLKEPHRHLYELLHTDICEMRLKSGNGFKFFDCLLMRLQGIATLFFQKRLIFTEDFLTYLKIALLSYLPFVLTRGQNT